MLFLHKPESCLLNGSVTHRFFVVAGEISCCFQLRVCLRSTLLLIACMSQKVRFAFSFLFIDPQKFFCLIRTCTISALSVYISLLEQQSKYGDALEVLSGKLGSLVMIEVDRLQIQVISVTFFLICIHVQFYYTNICLSVYAYCLYMLLGGHCSLNCLFACVLASQFDDLQVITSVAMYTIN